MTTTLFDLTGKTALVTGSSQGIGYGLAEDLKARLPSPNAISAMDGHEVRAQ